MAATKMSNDQSPWVVLKFGGTSVSSLQNWQNIATVVKQRVAEGYSVCVVHSALSGVSNQLQAIIEQARKGASGELLQKIKDRHLDLGQALEVDAEDLLKKDFNELEHIVKGIELIGEASYRVQARLLALGELMATKLGAAFLSRTFEEVPWLDARDIIKTASQKHASERSNILSAASRSEFDQQILDKLNESGPLVVTQGFIASDEEGHTVLLGRGGSDVSAAYLAAKINARRLEIWTDVPGMFSANPHKVPSARLLKNLSYQEAQEIAANGASVLHPRSIRPARKAGIPIQIRCTSKPELQGTSISADATDSEALVKALAVRNDIILVSMETMGMWQQVGFLAESFEIFKQYGLSIDLVSTSESNVTVSLDPAVNHHFHEIKDDFVSELSSHCRVEVIESLAAVSLLGRRIRTILHELGSAFEVFQEHHVYLVSQAANDLNFTFVVENEQAERLVRQLHEQVISHSGNQQSFGLTWPELMEEQVQKDNQTPTWWKKKREELLELTAGNDSCYVYDRSTLRRNAERIESLEAVDQSLYAIKANANPEVLKTFYERGLGFECVSIGEVQKVLELFPDLDPKKILFTPNFAPREEYQEGLRLGVHVTLDNIYPLQQWPELFQGQEIFLRIDPGHGSGHHEHVKTGGIHSKFGIPRFEIPEVAGLLKELSIKVKGLHAHTGSGIKDPLSWKTTAVILHKVARQLGGVDILDLGGGFGIRENEGQVQLDLQQVNKSLNQFRQVHPEYQLWVEPGRFLVASAGVLLTKVTQLKGKGKVRYVGVNTGMNSFIRPALYGARHTIVNLTKLEEPAQQAVNIVGPICESGDKLGIDRLFPDSEEGDVVLVANTGAYGRVMSSDYNLRPPAAEMVLG